MAASLTRSHRRVYRGHVDLTHCACAWARLRSRHPSVCQREPLIGHRSAGRRSEFQRAASFGPVSGGGPRSGRLVVGSLVILLVIPPAVTRALRAGRAFAQSGTSCGFAVLPIAAGGERAAAGLPDVPIRPCAMGHGPAGLVGLSHGDDVGDRPPPDFRSRVGLNCSGSCVTCQRSYSSHASRIA
jgi:hypothetical protein